MDWYNIGCNGHYPLGRILAPNMPDAIGRDKARRCYEKDVMSPPDTRTRLVFLCCLISLFPVISCNSPISKSVQREIDRDIPFQQLREHPESHKGKLVILGGEIIETRNQQEGTLIEVLQKRLDRCDRPRDEDTTGGRFLVLVERFLDPVVYSQGRRITVAGSVLGGQVEKIGEVDYVYPLLRAREIHLWRGGANSVYIHPYPVWYHWDLDDYLP